MSHASVTQDLFHARAPTATLDLLLDAWGTPVLLISSSAPAGRRLHSELSGPGDDVFHVTRAAGWQVALEALQAQDFSAIILDTLALDIDPQQALGLLRRVARGTPVFNLVSDPKQVNLPHPLTLDRINRRALLHQIRGRQRTKSGVPGAKHDALDGCASDRALGRCIDEIGRGLEPVGLDVTLEPLRGQHGGESLGWHTRFTLSSGSGRVIGPHEILRRAYACKADTLLLWQWLLQRGCLLVEQAEPGILVLPMTLNLGSHDALLRTLTHTLSRSALTPSQVRLECTEKEVMAQPELAAVWASELRLLGFGLGLTQVGREHSSFALLARLQPALVEVDPGLAAAVHTCPDARRALAGIVALAHSLGAEVSARHVQSVLQAEALRALGCDWFRG